jgi:hypothetical protein
VDGSNTCRLHGLCPRPRKDRRDRHRRLTTPPYRGSRDRAPDPPDPSDLRREPRSSPQPFAFGRDRGI